MADESTPKNVVSSIYRDALSPAAQELGKVLGGVVRAALSPAALVVLSIDEAFTLAQERVQDRFRRWGVPPERIIPPTVEIAEPVVRLLRFANQDSTLRELYLNLLARSMDASTQGSTHPAFADVLRQLSPLEARLLATLPPQQASIALLEVRSELPDNTFVTVLKHICDLGTELSAPCDVPTSAIDSLARVGILSIHTDQRVADVTLYENLEKSQQAQAAISRIKEEGGTVAFHHYLGEITAFGATFLGAISDNASPTTGEAPPNPSDA